MQRAKSRTRQLTTRFGRCVQCNFLARGRDSTVEGTTTYLTVATRNGYTLNHTYVGWVLSCDLHASSE